MVWSGSTTPIGGAAHVRPVDERQRVTELHAADYNMFDTMPAWLEATTGTVAERQAKLADPARRPGPQGRHGRPEAATWVCGSTR